MSKPLGDGIATALVCFISGVLCLLVLYFQGVKSLENEVKSSLMRLAVTASAFVDGDLHKTFTKPEQEKTPAYQQAIDPLRRILSTRKDIRFLYTMILRDGVPHIILDATPAGDVDHDGVEDHSPIMQAYNTPAPALMKALREGTVQIDDDPISDQWGVYLSGYAPFRDSGGNVVGIVGVDLNIGAYSYRISRMHLALGFGLLVDLLASFFIGIGIWWLRHRAIVSEQQREMALQALRQSEAEYRLLFDTMQDGFALHEIICDPAGKPIDYRFLAVNPAFERMTSLKPQQVIGRTVKEVLLHIEPFWIETYGKVALTGQPAHFENYVKSLGRHYEVKAYRPAEGQFACLFMDVTEHKRLQESLLEREERYHLLVDALTDDLFVYRILPDGTYGPFIEVNDEACRRLGYSREELLSLSPKDIDATESYAGLGPVIERLKAGETVTHEHTHVTKDGRHIPVELRARLVSLRGQPIVISLVRDISERKSMEQERHVIQEQLQQVQKLEGLGLLAGGIAHDFNNLLMAILGNIDLALEDLPKDSPATPNLDQIKKVSLRAAELCKQMLAYSGKGKFVVDATNLSHVVRDMTNFLEVSISKKAVLHLNLDDNVPAIMADVTQLRQVIMNLVINASEAIGEHSGAISVTTGAMECDDAYLHNTFHSEGWIPGQYVFLEVTDTGCGMDPATQARIFDPFYTTKFTGRGLGLAAVLGIVRGHKGAINIASEKGKGSTFRILFPASGDILQSEKHKGLPMAWRGSGTILLVDDEDAVQSIARRMIERIGFKVIVAANGVEAIAVFQAHRDDIVCVIMDLTMPHMDGDEAFHQIHRIKADVPVILSSGYNQQELSQRLDSKGMAAFIQKPYQMAQLIETLRSALSDTRSSTGSSIAADNRYSSPS